MIREPSTNPVDLARALEEQREALRALEGSALAGIAASLGEAAESLARTVKELRAERPGVWVDREGLRRHLANRTEDQFVKIAAEVPRHRYTDRVYLYNILEVDEWLMRR